VRRGARHGSAALLTRKRRSLVWPHQSPNERPTPPPEVPDLEPMPLDLQILSGSMVAVGVITLLVTASLLLRQ